MTNSPGDGWLTGNAYEAYMGRWSRPLARAFIQWLAPNRSGNWLEVGCGTGALTAAICELCEPASIVACDPSPPFIEYARDIFEDPRASFVVAAAEAPPNRDGGFDAIVSGLVLNFVPDAGAAVAAMQARVRAGGTVAAYVWDYAEGMQFLRFFWDEAVALDARAAELDEGKRFPLCRPAALASLFRAAGLAQVETQALDIPTEFASFDDYWTPFQRGTGPAPSYVGSLEPAQREILGERLRRRLHAGVEGRIKLRARAWAVRAVASAP
jgi:SAM-dependent methyltransferase